MKVLVAAASLTLLTATTGLARPALPISDDTYARVCLALEQSAERLLNACQIALEQPGITDVLRYDLQLSLGAIHQWNSDYQASIDAYEQALQIKPLSTEALSGIGWALRDLGQPDEAYAKFTQALAVDVTASALMGQAAVGREIGEINNDAARDMLSAALAIEPHSGFAQREIAWSYFEDGAVDLAIAAFEKRLNEDPDDVNARFGLGRAALRSEEPAWALTQFNRVLELDPNHTGGRSERLQALRQLDRNAQALSESDLFIEDHPDLTDGYIQRALALSGLERRAEALNTFEQAEAKLGPSNVLLYWYADTLAYDGRFTDALNTIDRALDLEGADASDHMLKSWIALELELYREARDSAEAALELGGEDPWAHFYAAVALVHTESTDEAVTRFQTAMATGLPEDIVGFFAEELVRAGDFVGAAQLRLKY